MGRNKIEIGRWQSDKIRLDIIRELKMESARLSVPMYEAVNRALWIGLQDIRRTKPAVQPKEEPHAHPAGPNAVLCQDATCSEPPPPLDPDPLT